MNNFSCYKTEPAKKLKLKAALTRDEKKVDIAKKLSKHLKLCIAIDKGYQIIFLWYWVSHKEKAKKNREAKKLCKRRMKTLKRKQWKNFSSFFLSFINVKSSVNRVHFPIAFYATFTRYGSIQKEDSIYTFQ